MMLFISQTLECILGCNDATTFVTYSGKTFIPVDNALIIIQDDKEHHWMPVPAGKYPIGHVAVSSCGVLCLTEKRLQIALHFFDATTLQKIGTADTKIRVEVTSLVFSEQGDRLYVLSTVPSSSVDVFQVGNGGANVTHVGGKALTRKTTPVAVVPGGSCENAPQFIVRYEDELHGFARGATGDDFDALFVIKMDTCGAAAFGSAALCFVTTENAVHVYSYEEKTQHEVCVLPSPVHASALCVAESTAFVGTSDGAVYSVNLLDGAVNKFALPMNNMPICRIEAASNGELLASSDDGLRTICLSASSDAEQNATLVKRWRTSPMLKCVSASGSSQAVAVSRGGRFYVYASDSVAEFVTGVAKGSVIDACLISETRLLLLYDDAMLHCFDTQSGKEVWRHECAECSPRFMETDGCGNVACCGADTVRFLRCENDAVADHGIVHATLLASIRFARFLPREDAVLAVCENGDVFLVTLPTEGSADAAHAAEALVKNAWRLEFPVTDALICFASPDVLNLFAHAADHDTKIYALDRRYEGETKVSRPLFLMGDHPSGGSTLCRLSDSTVLSCGRDGRIVARDLAPYQTQLPPTPPSREKRKPLWTCPVRSAFGGGITTATAYFDGTKLMCGGDDSVVHCMSLRRDNASQGTWKEPEWRTGGSLGTAARATGTTAASAASTHGAAAPERQAVLQKLDEVRAAWVKVMEAKDAEVPLEALMTDEQRAAFRVECDNAVHDMQEDQYYHSLLNDYLQDTIKQRCCDSMEVPRMKVVSMNVKELQVHNFHIHRATRKEASLSRKALFLRQLQSKIQGGRRTSLGAQASQQDGSAAADAGSVISSDYSGAMLNEADVYTQARMVVQSLLVKGHALALKDSFNDHFNDLQAMKKHAAAQMEERTARCVAIGKQLGDVPAPLYAPLVDPEEDPSSLFRVDDKELSAEAQALIVPSESVAVVSAVNEAALHLWMDGLEKEVERLEVDVPVPDFADESRDTFVPPEERTEEQLRALEVYAKALKEEQDRVNARKDALRSEFKALQQSNVEAAAKVDEAMKKVRQIRLNTVEAVDEAELQLSLIFRHRLRTLAAHRQYRLCAARIEALRGELVEAKLSLAQCKQIFARERAHHDEIELQMSQYAAAVSASYPFDDGAAGEKLHRRFVRWQRRFEDGKAPLPDPAAPVADCDAEQWAAFCKHCWEVSRVQDLLRAAAAESQQAAAEVSDAQRRCDSIEEQTEALQKEMQTVRDRSVTECLNTHMLCRLHQGQIQDEGTTTCTEFASSNLRWCGDVVQYNDLVLASDAESRALLEKIVQRRKLMKHLEWEKDKLQYDSGTLQMELRQLHTLRVTRQMQEFINGDAGVSEERRLASIQRHMELVEANMGRKVEDLRVVAQRLKKQIAERATENVIVSQQVGEVSSTVRDNAAVYQLIDTRADGANTYKARAKEIFETSELEEVARSQQEELVRLKREVDRLRERTFPSFAVVSKQTR